MSKKNPAAIPNVVEPKSLVLTLGKNTPQEVQANLQKFLEWCGYYLQPAIVSVPMPVQIPGQQPFTAFVDVPQIQLVKTPPQA